MQTTAVNNVLWSHNSRHTPSQTQGQVQFACCLFVLKMDIAYPWPICLERDFKSVTWAVGHHTCIGMYHSLVGLLGYCY